MMRVKIKTAAVMLTIIITLLGFTVENINSAYTQSASGNIDLFTQKESYNGKGPNAPSDMFGLDEKVRIYANVTYNEWPVQNLLVAFEIMGPRNPVENITFYRIAITNSTGIATIEFRTPSIVNESVFGEWNVIGVVSIAERIYQDTVKFKVGWIIEIENLKTINEDYKEQIFFPKRSYVGIEAILKNNAFTEKVATLTVTIYDNLSIPVNATELTDFIVEPNGTLVPVYFFLYIPETAYAGNATVYLQAYTKPTELGGVPYCPEFSKNFVITESRYFLRVKTEPAGLIEISGEGWYDEYTNVSLTAPEYVFISSNVRYRFSYWDIDGTPVSDNLISVFMDANHTATAHYVRQYYLSVKTDPLNIVDISGEGWYDEYTNVSLTASTVSNYSFEYWDVNGVSQGDGISAINVFMDAPKNATAHYVPIITYTLTIIATSGGKTDPHPGTYTYAADSQVKVKAIPEPNYVFDHWELDGVNVGSANPYMVLMDKDHTLEAVFSPAVAGWFIPEWFYWILFLLLLFLIVLVIILIYRRRKSKKSKEAFYSGWTAWYYGYDLRERTRKF